MTFYSKNVNAMELGKPLVSRELWSDKFVAFLFAVSPILNNYQSPIVIAGITILILMFPYGMIKLLRAELITSKAVGLVLPLFLFWMFKVVDHGTTVTELGQVMVYMVLVLVFATGCIDPKLLLRYATMVACFASMCIMVQYFTYYVLKFHLTLVPTNLLLDGSSQWIQLAKTGRISVTGRTMAFYRPSSFFLEPSHMFVYLSAPLYCAVLSDNFKRDKFKALLITAGTVLSTSGMGLMATAIVWGLFFAKNGVNSRRFSLRNLLRRETVVILLLGIGVLVICFFEVEFFRRSLLRIISSGDDYSNAIEGRLGSASVLMSQLSFKELLVGISDHYSEVDFHMTAFNATMYKYGIIGTALSYIFYLRCLIELKNQYFWLAALLTGLSFFNPHTHGTVYMLYFVTILLNGYMEQRGCSENVRTV